MKQRVIVYKQTQDNWHGNYFVANDCRVSNLVKVSFLLLSDTKWRVCIWGNDDFGYEKDFPKEKYDDAWKIFIDIISLEFVNQSDIESLEFVRA